MHYDSVILDFDGVVVGVLGDDERIPAFRGRINQTLGRADIQLADELIERLAHSMTYERLLAVSEQSGLSPEDIWRWRDDSLAEVLTEAARNGGKEPYEDVSVLLDLDVPLGIASNNQQRIVESILTEYTLIQYFETIHARDLTPESLQEKKPETTFLERAVSDLAVENPLFVGDKKSDIIAGERAGMDTVLIRREHNANQQIETEPTYEVNSLEGIAKIINSP